MSAKLPGNCGDVMEQFGQIRAHWRFSHRKRVMLRSTLLLAAGCFAIGVSGPARVQAAEHIPAYISAAIADPGRPAADKERDANRKPAETILFADIKPGETVYELIPSRGYFTRLFSKVVGPKGKVYALSPPRRPNAAPDSPDPVAATGAIAAQDAYSNVTALVGSLAKVSAPPRPVDVVFTAQNYHDLHNIPDFDVAAFNKSVFDVLKPGGLYIVLDHSAAAGSGVRDTSTLHRIDVATVKAEVLAAGFKLAGESKVLANAADDRTAKVFDPSIQGKTDQFILKFRKPKK
jgi:predicted methyltransferase